MPLPSRGIDCRASRSARSCERGSAPTTWTSWQRCHELTGGDPSLTEVVVQALRDIGGASLEALDRIEEEPPASLVEHVRHRLASCDASTRAVAEAAALAGRHSTVARLHDLTGQPVPSITRSVAELEAIDLLQGITHPVYRSPLEAAAVRSNVESDRAASLHGQMARLLHAHGGDDLDVADHLAASAPLLTPWAGPTLLRAGRRVSQSRDARTAVRWLRRALEEPLSDRDRQLVLEQRRVSWRSATAPPSAASAPWPMRPGRPATDSDWPAPCSPMPHRTRRWPSWMRCSPPPRIPCSGAGSRASC